MKSTHPAVIAAVALGATALSAVSADATTFVYNDTITLTAADIVSGGFDASIAGPAVTLQAGDTIEGTIDFAHSGFVTFSSTGNPGSQQGFLRFIGGGGGNSESYTFQFNDVSGSLLSTNPASANGFGNGVISASEAPHLTDSSFSFSSVSYSITLNAIGAPTELSARFAPLDLQVLGGSAQITQAVPEPAAWALMLVGFGGVGAALRRRRRAVWAAAN